ncbi:unnamed protein product [Scytosiphon promiscuus]
MKRHGDRKAHFERRQKGSFQWSGRVADRDKPPAAAAAAAANDADSAGSGSASGGEAGCQGNQALRDVRTPSTPGDSQAASPVSEQRTVRDLTHSASKGDGAVPLGEHHKGSFGVYMAHKMDKLRRQGNGAVARLEGPDGGLFKGVVAHFNGHFPVPVPTLREILVSRGGIVEAYNTSRCTHMICEVLPAAKIRELRKLRHPPPVVRSAWLEDSARARRKLPLADYMVDGIFVQKGTLAAAFSAASAGSASTPSRSPPATGSGVKRGRFSGTYGGSADGAGHPSDGRVQNSSSSSSSDGRQASPGAAGASPADERWAKGVRSCGEKRSANGSSSTSQASPGAGMLKSRYPSQPATAATAANASHTTPNARYGRSGPAAAGWSEVASPPVVTVTDGRAREANGSAVSGVNDHETGQWRPPPPPESAKKRKAVAAAAGGELPEVDRQSGGWEPPAGGVGRDGGNTTPGGDQTAKRMSSLSTGSQRQQHQQHQPHMTQLQNQAQPKPVQSQQHQQQQQRRQQQGWPPPTPTSPPPSLPRAQQKPATTPTTTSRVAKPTSIAAAASAAKPSGSHANGKGLAVTTPAVEKLSDDPLPEVEPGKVGNGREGGAINKPAQPLQSTARSKGGSGSGDGGGSGGGSHEPSHVEFPPPLELPEAWPHEIGGRSTKDDPAFMKTFFQNSRLHFIGVGRAHAVKVVNAGLAARKVPGAVQPIFGRSPLGRGETRVILHVDMDCFFVSVLVKNRPELKDKPVAVAHNASNAKGAGSSEISSCNYPARAKGLRAGMFMMQAKKLCPELIVLRYDFEAYTEASEKMYGVFLRHAPVVMAVSCDEAFLELAEGTDPMAAATQIRRRIFEETGCSASAGASNNMLLARYLMCMPPLMLLLTLQLFLSAFARIATKEAKPNGQFWLPAEVAMRHIGPLPVQDLPGVGWKLRKRLNEEGLNVCSDLWRLSLTQMQKGLGLGDKTGLSLWEACRGIDKRPVQAPPDRKSIGAEVNYGVRFDTQAQASGFLSELAVELSRRMATEGVLGRALTLKIMKQKDGVGLPRKYLGHGICDARSKLLNLGRATADADTLKSHALHLLKEAKIPPDKIRGIGLQMTRLVSDPGGVEEGQVQGQEEGSTLAAATSPAPSTPTRSAKPPSSATVRQTSPWSMTKNGKNAADVARPTVSDTRKDVEEASASVVTQTREAERTAVTPSGKGTGGGGTTALRQTPSTATREAAPSSGAVSSRKDELHREEGRDGQGAPRNDDRSPPLQKLAKPLALDAAATPPSTSRAEFPAKSEAEATWTRPDLHENRAEGAGADAGSSSTGRERKAPGAGYPGIGKMTDVRSIGGSATPPRRENEQGRTRRASHEDTESPGVASPSGGVIVYPAFASQGGDARRRRRPDPGSPELLSPPTPSDRVPQTPSTGAVGSPSMSQITFSQIDKTVLRALPPDLRREVISQVEARKRQRQHDDVADLTWVLPLAVTRQSSTAQINGTKGSAPIPITFIPSEPARNTQQVSIDSLWSLQKRREEGADAPGGESSVFDQDSLRALPLGLRLKYASLTENQREQIARRYAQQEPPATHGAPTGGRSAQDESRARRLSSKPRPPSPLPIILDVELEDGGGKATPPSGRRRQRPSAATPALSPPRSAELHRLSLSQVDHDVLDCLPPDVRDEVLRTDEVVDVCSPSFSPPRSSSPERGGPVDAEGRGGRNRADGGVFDFEPAGALRGVLRKWMGGAVRSPSQWHLELLYRYLEELVEAGRLDETATLLRCLGRLSSKADKCTAGIGHDAPPAAAAAAVGGGTRGWVTGYRAVLAAVQELVRERTGGASLALVC